MRKSPCGVRPPAPVRDVDRALDLALRVDQQGDLRIHVHLDAAPVVLPPRLRPPRTGEALQRLQVGRTGPRDPVPALERHHGLHRAVVVHALHRRPRQEALVGEVGLHHADGVALVARTERPGLRVGRERHDQQQGERGEQGAEAANRHGRNLRHFRLIAQESCRETRRHGGGRIKVYDVSVTSLPWPARPAPAGRRRAISRRSSASAASPRSSAGGASSRRRAGSRPGRGRGPSPRDRAGRHRDRRDPVVPGARAGVPARRDGHLRHVETCRVAASAPRRSGCSPPTSCGTRTTTAS